MFSRSIILAALLCAFALATALPELKNPDERRQVERIQSETDPVRKIILLTQLAAGHPSRPAERWAWERLQSLYFDRGAYSPSLEAGQHVLDLDPTEVDAAARCLQAAQSLKVASLIQEYAVETWERASKLAAGRGSRAEFAREVMSNAEFALVSLMNHPDPQTREAAQKALRRINPHYLKPDAVGTADRIA